MKADLVILAAVASIHAAAGDHHVHAASNLRGASYEGEKDAAAVAKSDVLVNKFAKTIVGHQLDDTCGEMGHGCNFTPCCDGLSCCVMRLPNMYLYKCMQSCGSFGTHVPEPAQTPTLPPGDQGEGYAV